MAGIACAPTSDPPKGNDSLRLSFLALELRRIERELRRRAAKPATSPRSGELALAKQRVRNEMAP